MTARPAISIFITALLGSAGAAPATADPVFLQHGNSRRQDGGRLRAQALPLRFREIEAADDFILTSTTTLTSATFTGLVPQNASVADVVVEIYRVFPKDSDVTRTSGPPTFSTPQVPTRVNSPSDAAFASRDNAGAELVFPPATSAPSPLPTACSRAASIPSPTRHGRQRPVTGDEVQFDVSCSRPVFCWTPGSLFRAAGSTFHRRFSLVVGAQADHGRRHAFLAGSAGLDRDEDLDPDWFRVGTDIVGGQTPPTFNMTSLR